MQKRTTPAASLSKEGNRGLLSSSEEGMGVVRLCVLCAVGGRGTNAFSARGHRAEVRRIAKKMLFRGNEAKKLLKINDITF